jgi:glycerol-3-phosphate acyltransferase PlsX
MGGDGAPHVVLEGAQLALEKYDNVRFLIFGDKSILSSVMEEYPSLANVSEIGHTSESVSMEDKPSQVLRQGRQTSMAQAVGAVKKGRAEAVVSAGNTGALMGLAKFYLRDKEGVERPALAAQWPTLSGSSVVLDVGANVDATAKQLTDFAVMGMSFSRVVLNIKNPKVALLNIGQEELKGRDVLRDAASILKTSKLGMNFVGFVEGDGISMGVADVIVTDGFTGNVAIKTAEGTARLIANFVKDSFGQSAMAKIGAAIAAGALKSIKTKMDPRDSNGGVFLGLSGIVVKSHGGTDGKGFASAIGLAIDLARGGFIAELSKTLTQIHEELGTTDLLAGSDDCEPDGADVSKEVAAQ